MDFEKSSGSIVVMNKSTEDKIAELCTAIGMVLEDSGAKMVLGAYASKDQLRRTLEQLDAQLSAIHVRIAHILRVLDEH